MHAMIKKIKERGSPQKVMTAKENARQAVIGRILDYEKKKALSGMKF